MYPQEVQTDSNSVERLNYLTEAAGSQHNVPLRSCQMSTINKKMKILTFTATLALLLFVSVGAESPSSPPTQGMEPGKWHFKGSQGPFGPGAWYIDDEGKAQLTLNCSRDRLTLDVYWLGGQLVGTKGPRSYPSKITLRFDDQESESHQWPTILHCIQFVPNDEVPMFIQRMFEHRRLTVSAEFRDSGKRISKFDLSGFSEVAQQVVSGCDVYIQNNP